MCRTAFKNVSFGPEVDWFRFIFPRDEAKGYDYLCLCHPSLFIVDRPFLSLDPLAISDSSTSRSGKEKANLSLWVPTSLIQLKEDVWLFCHSPQRSSKSQRKSPTTQKHLLCQMQALMISIGSDQEEELWRTCFQNESRNFARNVWATFVMCSMIICFVFIDLLGFIPILIGCATFPANYYHPMFDWNSFYFYFCFEEGLRLI